MIIYTSINWAYLPKARLLAKSVKQHIPDATFVLAMLERNFDDPTLIDPDFDVVIGPDELGIPNLDAWIFTHNVVEACTAQKGRVLQILLDRYPTEAVVYLDPDIEVYSDLLELKECLANSDVVLTPHLAHPEDTKLGIESNELSALIHGTYNLGFVAVSNTTNGRIFADWWSSRLIDYCYDEKSRGIFTDQKWVDLAPGLFDGIHILRHPSYNIATWNISQRNLVWDTEQECNLINGTPIRFIHYSGFDSGAHVAMLEKFAADNKAFKALSNSYTHRLNALEVSTPSTKSWTYSVLNDGTPVNNSWRRAFRDSDDYLDTEINPFDLSAMDFAKYENQGRRTQFKIPLVQLVTNPKLWNLNVIRTELQGLIKPPTRTSNSHPLIQLANSPLGQQLAEQIKVGNETTRADEIARGVQNLKKFALADLPTVVYISHGLGGGVDRHIENLSDLGLSKANIFVVSAAGTDDRNLQVRLSTSSFNPFELFTNLSTSDIVTIIRELNPNIIHLHQVMNLEKHIKPLLDALAIPYIVTIHDYYFLTPNWTFRRQDGSYFKFPTSNQELEAINSENAEINSNSSWGKSSDWVEILNSANLIIFPSNSAKLNFDPFISNGNSTIAYHPEFPSPEILELKKYSKANPQQIRVAVFGDLGPHKGSILIEKIIDQSPSEMIFVGFGQSSEQLERKFDYWHGPYDSQEIVNLLTKNEIDVVLLPMQIEETYSYSASEALASGAHIVASNIQVFKERFAARKDVILKSPAAEPSEWLNAISDVVNATNDIDCAEIGSNDFDRSFYQSEYWERIKNL